MNALDKLSVSLINKYPKIEKKKIDVVSKEEVAVFFDEIVVPSLETIKTKLKEHKINSIINKYTYTAKIIVHEPIFKFCFRIEYSQLSSNIEIRSSLQVQNGAKISTFMSKHILEEKIINDYKTINQEMIIEYFTRKFSDKEDEFLKADEESRKWHEKSERSSRRMTRELRAFFAENRELEEYYDKALGSDENNVW